MDYLPVPTGRQLIVFSCHSYLGRQGPKAELDAAVLVSPPWNFHLTTPTFNLWSSFHLVKGLQDYCRQNEPELRKNTKVGRTRGGRLDANTRHGTTHEVLRNAVFRWTLMPSLMSAQSASSTPWPLCPSLGSRTSTITIPRCVAWQLPGNSHPLATLPLPLLIIRSTGARCVLCAVAASRFN